MKLGEFESLRLQREAESLDSWQSRRTEAIPLFEKALIVRERSFGLNHSSLVPLLIRLGRYERVLSILAKHPTLLWDIEVYRRTRVSPQAKHVTDHDLKYLYEITRAVALNGLGVEAESARNFGVAGRFYRESLKVQQELDGPDSSRMLAQLNLVAGNWFHQGNYAGAEFNQRRVIRLLQNENARSLGNGLVVGRNLEFLASDCAIQGKLDEASTLYSQVLDRYDATLKRNDPYIVFCLEAHAQVLRRLGRLGEAVQLEQRAAHARLEWPKETGSKRMS